MGIRGQFVERLEYTSSRVVHLFQAGAKTTSHPWRKISRVGNENAVKKREESRERFSRLVLFPSHDESDEFSVFTRKSRGKRIVWRRGEREREIGKRRSCSKNISRERCSFHEEQLFYEARNFSRYPLTKVPPVTHSPVFQSKLSLQTYPPSPSISSRYIISNGRDEIPLRARVFRKLTSTRHLQGSPSLLD